MTSNFRFFDTWQTSTGVVVCEQSGQLAVALRREISAIRGGLHETRSIEGAWKMLARLPAGFVIVQLSAGWIDPLIKRFTRLERDFPRARVALVADRSLILYEGLLREAGAIHFTTNVRQLQPLVTLIQRHFDQLPVPRKSLSETIWARLPWSGTKGQQGRAFE